MEAFNVYLMVRCQAGSARPQGPVTIWNTAAAPPPQKKKSEELDTRDLREAQEAPRGPDWTGSSRPQPGQLVYIYICVCVCVCARALSQLQSVGSLKVTIQQSSESREFGQTDRTADRQAGGLHCHVCNLTCCSLQVFHEHMSGAEHMKKLHEITNSICLHTHTLQDRGRRPGPRHWCDACQTHFSGDVIVHRRTKQHKLCKQLCRPFCPVCKRHFRTPRKFVEHMKSPEHKQQVHLQDVQEEELITVDAVGCFEEEEEVEEVEEVGVADDEVEEQTEVTEDKDSFVVPVSGFLCRLCNKFFHREATARHTHCRTHTHYLNLQVTHTQMLHHLKTLPPETTSVHIRLHQSTSNKIKSDRNQIITKLHRGTLHIEQIIEPRLFKETNKSPHEQEKLPLRGRNFGQNQAGGVCLDQLGREWGHGRGCSVG
uniref:Cip1-interacting zinc finger protein-like n=1 Tax=Echeneis naucrates TaxID=173247 RepID=A0A665VWL8_ECHNA